MNHQIITGINPDYDWTDEDRMDAEGIEDYIPVDATKWKVLKEWTFKHHGGSGEDWRQAGKIVIYDNEVEETYLEASVKGTPFLSLRSTLDQWGTWHSLKLTPGSLRANEENGTLIYAQEWGNPSFLESLGEALIYMAHHTEPDHTKYGTGESPWRREE